ncbi:two-component regulator propeller domain-containing protein [Carboxylicivirga sp. M1479]|uniref:ligand-binding sensor domain-containing protein n=1 Tax=Carboxylicivirga sp. M1479 TaxID=2594476 RepID=UPI00117827DE|nr:two-component regulator propeller domain-containing protein [Carboxylicivirga sp. M1479]TRX65755.1 SpoIIE family protein phosphatase [Carboxylicivirga sp. M1479]
MSVLIQRLFGHSFRCNGGCRYKAVIILLVVCATLSSAQSNRLSVDRFTIKEGLSNSHITTLFQDSRGYIWVGTSDGLNRYDGYGFAIYRHHPLIDSTIVGNYIQSIIETPDGNIWIGTRNSGIAVWQRETGTFLNIGKESDLFKGLRENGVYGMQSIGDYVWTKTRNAIAKINHQTKEFTKYDHYSSVLKKGNSSSYSVASTIGKVWFGSKDGIQCINKEDDVLHRIEAGKLDKQVEVSSLVVVSDTILLAGSEEGLWKYDINNGVINQVYKKTNQRNVEGINTMYACDDGKIWLATANGLMYSHAPYDDYLHYEVSQQFIDPLRKITAILVDASGLLWLGTEQDGLFKIDQKPSKFSSISVNDDMEYPIDCYDFNSVFVDDENNLWLGTAQKGIYRINRDTKQFKHYTIYPAYVDKNDPDVNCIYKDSKGNMWFGTDEGIFKMLAGSQRIHEYDYTLSSDFRYLLKTNVINDIIEDRLGHMWFASQFGLYRFDGNKIVSYWSDSDADYSLCDDEVNVLFEDEEGQIWIGTNNGINIYNVVSRTFESIRNQDGKDKVLSHNIISAFAEDHDKIVIGTHSGLSYFDKNAKTTSFWMDDDLLSGKVYAVEIDDYNRIWVSTGIGISSIIPGTPPFHYNNSDGVPDYNFNVGASCKYMDNQLFFGGDKGLTIIDSQDVPTNINKPKVVVNDVKVFRKGRIQDSYEGELEKIEVLYRRNTMIRVSFAALEYTYPSANTYRIKLEGHDEEWRDVTYTNFVNFSNLSPGEYTLRVKGANNDGVLSNNEAKLEIDVVPPLWMSGYAYAFYLIFGILLIQTLINYRIRNYRKAYKALNEKALDKKRIEVQKESLSRVHQSLTDSISYAKRIQEAMIPSEEMVKKIVPESFIYYRPKDIVSGDFYWVYRKDHQVFFAAVDCTGHGVPGAFMSIIGYDLLKKIVEIQEEHSPGRILDQLSREVALTFQKNGQDGSLNKQSVDDGMDVALIKLDEERRVLHFAGAMNPLYIIRDNELMTIKGDRFPIGYSDDTKQLSYSNHEIEVYPNDAIYLFSDGFADQFGGPEGKKFKYRRFRHLLLNIHKLPIDDQKAILHQKMEEWMGTEYEQVDDILLMGFRL